MYRQQKILKKLWKETQTLLAFKHNKNHSIRSLDMRENNVTKLDFETTQDKNVEI